MPLTREEVYRLAVADHSEGWPDGEAPRIVQSAANRQYPDTEPHPRAGSIYHFGVYWRDDPTRLRVVTYGPRVIFCAGQVVGYDPDAYECWAS